MRAVKSGDIKIYNLQISKVWFYITRYLLFSYDHKIGFPGANPTIVSYNLVYDATNSIARF
jgi:hypothetical protein